VSLEVTQRKRIINDCIRLISTSKSLETRISRCECLIEQSGALLVFEKRGIPTLTIAPSELLLQYRKERERMIVEGLKELVVQTLAKARLASSDSSRITHATKAILKIQDYIGKTSEPGALEALQNELKEFIHRTQLNVHLEAAKRAEFKGQNMKALDKYRDALYFLRHDEIEDALQKDQIETIEQKVAELERAIEGKQA
jgi:hypothetical protein